MKIVPGKYAFFWGTTIFFIVFFFAWVAHSAAYEEETLKAFFIEKITRFIEWPAGTSMDDPSTPFIFGVIGKSSLEQSLKQVFSTIKIQDKSVQFLWLSDPSEITNCHLLFIAKNNKENLPNILAITRKNPILTLSHSEGFAHLGVHVNIYVENSKIRFEINESACKESGLKVSFLLLQLAKIINPAHKRE